MLAFTALADPTRRRIVEMLAEGERTAGEIVARFDMTAPAISQHLKMLREAGLVNVRADGQRRIHSLDQGGFSEMEAWIAKTKRFWENRLDVLEQTLRAEDEKKKKPSAKKK
ncbi:ArsR family transcriptional regulator [Roseimicrobium gellanilyticum]|uniref:ArsR family transcriptional regulator n=1 Tax=Roseimicrobium gellanilyticum TaxID=748857 RepID=A0A366HNL0_9BACT|nr:metalloregulator ArsR/SmtB family transcription factor [Roseimicrobium gellanilyticum]RBP43821.1 ArsR family transcriptional regulator [Roseimicrobium gellanilyticum]